MKDDNKKDDKQKPILDDIFTQGGVTDDGTAWDGTDADDDDT